MAKTLTLEVTLSDEALEFVRRKIASGEYLTESEVLANSLELFREEDEEQDRFEIKEVIPAFDEVMADPGSAIPMEQVRQNLEAGRLQRLKAS